MSIKVGLQYIDLWKKSLEQQVCRYKDFFAEVLKDELAVF